MTETNGVTQEPPKIQVTNNQATVLCYYDLAIQTLVGMSNQLGGILRNPGAAEHFIRVAEKLAEKREGFLKNSQNRIQVVPAAEVA